MLSLGREIEEYLETMEDDEEWKRVSDGENVTFILKKLPENIEFIHAKLTQTLMAAEE